MLGFMGEKDLLSDSFILQANNILQLEPEVLNALYHAAKLVRNDTGLRELAWHCQHLAANSKLDAVEFAPVINHLSKVVEDNEEYLRLMMDKHRGMFAVLVALIALPWTVQFYRVKGITEDILIATMSDLTVWMKSYHDNHGVWGLGGLGWLLNHLGGRLYRLGRLQFIWEKFTQSVVVLRNIHNEEVVVLSEPGVHYQNDGQVDGTNGIYDHESSWVSHFSETSEGCKGNPITRSGAASKDTLYLSYADWRVELRRDDHVLEVHIAEGSKMAHEECVQSFIHAVRFYREFFPEHGFCAFTCSSWLLDPQLALILPEYSNIVRFQKEFHLIPVQSDEVETYQRVFGKSKIDTSTENRDTGLRRAILDYVEAGNQMHGAAGVILLKNMNSGL